MMQNMHSSQNCNMNSCQHRSMNCNFNSACNNNRNQNCNCNMNQQNLKCYIDFVSFAALDCAMFLDTHPKNAEGLEYFEYYTNARKQALKEYSSRLTLYLKVLTSGHGQMNRGLGKWRDKIYVEL